MSVSVVAFEPCAFDDIELVTAAQRFDLHNCFHFVGFTYDVATCVLTLRWIPSGTTSPEQGRSLTVELRDVTHLSAMPRNPRFPSSEDRCLHCVGRVPASAPTLDSPQPDAPPDWHYIFTFTSGFTLRVAAASVRLLR